MSGSEDDDAEDPADSDEDFDFDLSKQSKQLIWFAMNFDWSGRIVSMATWISVDIPTNRW